MLVVSLAVIVLALMLSVGEHGGVHLLGIPGLRLPPLCASRALFGVTCPGCGLTRSFVHLARGDLTGSCQAHSVGWMLALAVVAQVPYRILSLCSRTGYPLGRLLPVIVATSLIAVLLVAWMVKVLNG